MIPALSAGDVAILQRAFARVQASDGAGADALLRGLPLAARGHPDALMVAAFAQQAQGRAAAARPLFESALRAAPGHAGILNSYANLLTELGDTSAALVVYRQAVTADPRSTATWTNLALAAIGLRQWPEAEAALARALALSPTDARSLSALGLLEQGRGRHEAAVTAYNRVLAANPADAMARHNMATALRTLGRLDAALAALARPTLADSAALRGHILADLGRFEDAVAQYRDLLRAAPDHLRTLEALAELLPQVDRKAEALDGYRTALQHPAATPVWRAAIGAAKGVGDPEQTLQWARTAETLHGHHPDWSLAQAGALSQLGDAAAALNLTRHTAAAFPQSAAAENYLAWLLLKSGDPAAAEPHALRAAQLAPHDQSPWALLTLIWRLLADRRDAWLADYDTMAIATEIATPAGWPNLHSFLADLSQTLTGLHRTQLAPAEQSLRGGTQTRGTLFESTDPILTALHDSLVSTVDASLASLAPDPTHPFLGRLPATITMSGSWSVRLRGQGFHISHIHPSGWLSSAFYVDVPPEVGDPASDAGNLLFGVPDAALGLDLAPRRIITPAPGRLAIFPSYFWHGTAPFESAGQRLTVAFDALPKP